MRESSEEEGIIQIVPTNRKYHYDLMQQNIRELKRAYPFLEIKTAGYSVLGKPIPYIKIGNGEKQVLYHASIHANEWITSVLLMKFIENFCKAYIFNQIIQEYSVHRLFEDTSLYIIPMVNPDGVDLVTGNVDIESGIYKKYETIAHEFATIPFPSGWKANFNGVDLNLQFPAGWENAKRIKFKQGFTTPAPRDFVGEGPLTQPEALMLYDFTLTHNFALTISYHTQGKEIYWDFQNSNPPRGYEIGQKFARLSGYSLEEVPYNSSFAGYKDWFIQDYNRPGYTIEVGEGVNPLPISQFKQIYQDNEGILISGMINA